MFAMTQKFPMIALAGTVSFLANIAFFAAMTAPALA
jgi:hypothetical protein